MRHRVIGAVLAALVLPMGAAAEGFGTYTLNVTWTGYPDLCAGWFLDDAGLACDDLDSDWGPYGSHQLAWVIVSGIPPADGGFGTSGGIGGLQFGIEYDPAFALGAWTVCTGGSEIPDAGWPASGTGNAITWAGGCYPEAGAPDGSTKVGFFSVSSEADATLRLTADPRIGMALAADCSPTVVELCEDQLGSGSAIEGGRSQNTCGQLCDATPAREVTWGAIKAHY